MTFLHLGFIDKKKFEVDADQIVTGRTCVIGSSGSGKSYTVGVICEELCKNYIPFAMIDTEGEYSGLKEKYEAIWIGEEEQCDLKWSTLDLDELARQALHSPPLILDLSDVSNPKEKVAKLLTGIYAEISKQRVPYLIVLEEADRFIPQSGDKLQIFDEIARRGRKRGLGLMLCTQRPSLVDKNVLSQCGNQVIGKLVIRNDLQSVAHFFQGRTLPKQLTTLSAGKFYAMGALSPIPSLIKIRKKITKHGGITPKLAKRIVKPSAEIIARLRGIKAPVPETLGLPPTIAPNDVPLLIKRQKSFVLFGKEEIVTKVNLLYRPLIEVAVRIRKGTLRKKYETMSFVLDGITGKFAELSGRLSLREGLERFLGLAELQVSLLRKLYPSKDSSAEDVASKIGISGGMARKPLSQLEAKRLVRSSKLARIKVFRRLVDIPKIKLDEWRPKLEQIVLAQAEVELARIRENEVRDVVKGFIEGSDVESFKPFLYPLYRVELALKNNKRTILIDGRTGNEVQL